MTRLTRAVATQLAGMALLGVAVIALARLFPVVEWITQMQHRLAAMQFWGAFLYPFLFAACNILLLPGGVVAMGGGLFFGLWWGTFLVLSGNLIGAAFAFGVSRCLGRAWRLFCRAWLVGRGERGSGKTSTAGLVSTRSPFVLISMNFGVSPSAVVINCRLRPAEGRARGKGGAHQRHTQSQRPAPISRLDTKENTADAGFLLAPRGASACEGAGGAWPIGRRARPAPANGA